MKKLLRGLAWVRLLSVVCLLCALGLLLAACETTDPPNPNNLPNNEEQAMNDPSNLFVGLSAAEEISYLEQNALVAVSNWGAGPDSVGTSGKAVLENNEVYTWSTFEKAGEDIEYTLEYLGLISDEDGTRIKALVKERIAEDYENIVITDAGSTVYLNINGEHKTIKNNDGLLAEIQPLVNTPIETPVP
jgi:hypothetical protein